MALELNFFHEQLQLQKQRNRDPFKLGMLVLLVVAIVLLVFYFIRAEQVYSLRRQRMALEADYQKLAPKQAEAVKLEQSLAALLKTSEKVLGRIESRFYWAPLLEQITQAIPRNVQLTQLRGSIAPDNANKIVVDIGGVAAEKEPRIAAEGVRSALAVKMNESYVADVTFQALEDGTETASLDGRNLPTAHFNIRLELSRKTSPSAPQHP